MNLTALRGLAPVTALNNAESGKSALAGNLLVTSSIQHGILEYAGAPAFENQQQQALRDAFITDGNAYEIADGLGSTLSAAYRKRATFNSPENGRTKDFASLSPRLRGCSRSRQLRRDPTLRPENSFSAMARSIAPPLRRRKPAPS